MLQLTQKEMESLYNQDKTSVWAYRTLYTIFYSQAQQLYYMAEKTRLFKDATPVTKRGRWAAMTTAQAEQFLR